jgi:hypothetical protein
VEDMKDRIALCLSGIALDDMSAAEHQTVSILVKEQVGAVVDGVYRHSPEYPQIDLCFQGWLRGVEVQSVMNVKTDEIINTAGMSGKELADKLNDPDSGWAISFGDALDNANKEEIELSDFEGCD